ncbi:MAG TPA: hypothetical protein VL096_18755 [Pirellulaceae bacterium]|nr:hypothetical protein [Pirellulaceae bacterium]
MKIFATLLASCLLSAGVLFSAAPAAETAPLKTGTAFRQELADPAGISWTQPPLRSALTSLREAKGVAIVLDRRVDPEQLVEFNSDNAPLDDALKQLATRLKLGVSIFDSTVYLGPERVTARLATVAAINQDRALQAPPDVKRKLASLPALTTEALSTPRELLEAWSNATNVSLVGLEQVPHDLWPAIRFPAQPAMSRACLILAGFDLTILLATDGASAKIVQLPEKAVLERDYPGGNTPEQRAAQIEKSFPQAKVTLAGKQLHISGSYEDHDLIARLLRGEKITRTEVRGGEQRYTLNVENQPVGAVAQALGNKLKMKVTFDPAIQDQLEQRVSFKVNDATFVELMEKMLGPLNLQGELVAGEMRIGPKK